MTSTSEVSPAAREYRTAMRLAMVMAIVVLALAYAGARRLVPVWIGATAGVAFLLTLILVAVLGYKLHTQLLADRERHGRLSIVLLISAQLASESDDSLAAIASRGGPAGEAAEMLLQGRREKSRKV